MDAAELHRIKCQVMQRYRDGMGGVVWGLGIEFQYVLDQSPLFDVGRVKKTGDPECMIEATCRPASASVAPQALADDLERRWREDICQGFSSREAHALAVSDEAVTLDFVAVHDGDRRYVTGEIVIDLRPRPGKKAGRRAVNSREPRS